MDANLEFAAGEVMVERMISLNKRGSPGVETETLAALDADEPVNDEASSVRGAMPREIGSGQLLDDVEERLEKLSVMEASLQDRVAEAVDSELERNFSKPANELRADPTLTERIRCREREILDYMKAEISAERELITLYL